MEPQTPSKKSQPPARPGAAPTPEAQKLKTAGTPAGPATTERGPVPPLFRKVDWLTFIISTLAHFAVGAAKSLVTTRSWWASGAEMTIVGIAEAAITYGLGRAFAGF